MRPLAMPGPKIDKAEQRQRREDQGQRVVDGRRVVEAAGELAEDRRADADDDGEHQDLDAGRDDVAEHLLGEEGGAAEEAERHEDEAGERRQLELDQADEELDRHDEEADDDDQPGDQQDGDLDEVVEEAGEAHQAGDRGEDRLAGVDADLGERPGCRSCAWLSVPPPASRPRPAKELKMIWARLLKLPMMKAKTPI